MKYIAILAFAAGVLALPEGASVTSAPALSSASAVPLSPTVSCINACPASNVDCKAACLGIARPNASQAIDTNKCAAKCDQGDGTASAAIAFSKCVQGCIASLFPSSQTAFGDGGAGGASAASGASATGTGTGARPSGSAASSAGSADASGSRSGSAAGPQSTGAAMANTVHVAGAGLAGLLAVFAL